MIVLLLVGAGIVAWGINHRTSEDDRGKYDKRLLGAASAVIVHVSQHAPAVDCFAVCNSCIEVIRSDPVLACRNFPICRIKQHRIRPLSEKPARPRNPG